MYWEDKQQTNKQKDKLFPFLLFQIKMKWFSTESIQLHSHRLTVKVTIIFIGIAARSFICSRRKWVSDQMGI